MQKNKNRKGITYYREKIYLDGKAIFSPRFQKKSDASTWKARFLNEKSSYLATGKKSEVLCKEIEPKIPEPVMPKLSEYAKTWIERKIRCQLMRRSYERYLSNLRLHILPLFGELALDKIQRIHMTKLIDELFQKGHTPIGINIIAGVFKRVLLEAYREEVILKYPFLHVKKLKEHKRMDTYLTYDEIHKVLNVCSGHFFHILFTLAVNTGLRRGELAALTWRKIFFEQNLIEIGQSRDRYGVNANTKTVSSKRYVPLNTMLKNYLLSIKPIGASPDDFLILDKDNRPFDVNHAGRIFNLFLKRAKITSKYRFHDIRHSFASHFMMNGGNIYDLQKILGHTSLEMTQRYAHLAPEHLLKASNIVSFGNLNSVNVRNANENESKNSTSLKLLKN